MANKQSAKAILIIESALEILKTQGDHGLTMRQVAGKAGVTLSNVQYYFKNKDELLKAMVDLYFTECSLFFTENIPKKEQSAKEKIEELIRFGLDEEENLEDMCRMFREFWAISTRNEEISSYLNEYYKDYCMKLTAYFNALETDETRVAKAVSLLIPYFEGYAITKNALPHSKSQMVQTLTEIVNSILFDK